MSNTPWKSRQIPQRIAGKNPAIARNLAFPAPLFAGPWKQGLQGSDAVPAARRTLVCQHTGGGGGFLVHNDPPVDATQEYPEAGTWRAIHRSTCSLSPGCILEARIIAMRSGMTEYFTTDGGGAWLEYGANGRIRITVDYDNGTDTDSVTAEEGLEPSQNDDGAEPTAAGSAWGYMLFKYIPAIAPQGVLDKNPSELAKWSENTVVTITIEHQGGARIIQCAVSERPWYYAVAHDEEDEVSVHAWPPDLQPTAWPQTEAQDGATYEEHRQGTTKARVVAARQTQRLGPIIATGQPYAETLAAVTDTELPHWEVTSTTPVGLSIGSSITAWSSNGPGYKIFAYTPPAPENLDSRLGGNAATIPVRIRTEARFSAAGSNTGTIRWQSSSRSWVDINVDQSVVGDTWTPVTITGWLESMVAPNDPFPNLQDFAWVSGGTMQVRGWTVEYGAYPVPA